MLIKTLSRNARWLSTLTLLTLTLLIHSGCAVLPDYEKPRISLNNIVLKETGSITPALILSLDVENPNDFSFDINGLDVTFTINDQVVAHGLSDQNLTIPRYSNGQLDVKASIQLLSFLQQIFALTIEQEFTYEVSGHVHAAKDWFGAQKIEFSETGKLDTDDIFNPEKKSIPKNRKDTF